MFNKLGFVYALIIAFGVSGPAQAGWFSWVASDTAGALAGAGSMAGVAGATAIPSGGWSIFAVVGGAVSGGASASYLYNEQQEGKKKKTG